MDHTFSSRGSEDLLVVSAKQMVLASTAAGRAAPISGKGEAAEGPGLGGEGWIYSMGRWLESTV